MSNDDTQPSEAPTPVPVRCFRPDLLFRIKEIVEELRLRDGVEVVDFELFDPVSRIVADTIESGMGRVVPTAIRSFYDQSDGLRLRWTFREDDGGGVEDGGEIDLFGFGEVFGSWLDRLWGVTGDGGEDFSWELRGIDGGPAGPASGFMTVLQMADSGPQHTLFWHEPGGESFPLSCDFFDYVHFALQTRGIHGWPLALVEPALVEASPRAQAALARFREVAGRVFPDDPHAALPGATSGVSVHHP